MLYAHIIHNLPMTSIISSLLSQLIISCCFCRGKFSNICSRVGRPLSYSVLTVFSYYIFETCAEFFTYTFTHTHTHTHAHNKISASYFTRKNYFIRLIAFKVTNAVISSIALLTVIMFVLMYPLISNSIMLRLQVLKLRSLQILYDVRWRSFSAS